MTIEQSAKPATDWELIELHYRAGIKTVRQLATEFGVSHTAIQKRAKKFEWVRNLAEKIQQTTQHLVATKVVASKVATGNLLSDAATVKAYSEVMASVEMTQRSDIEIALTITRSHMLDLAALCNPDFADDLAHLGELLAQPDGEDGGKAKMAKLDELYRYIALLPGRVKTMKEISASHGTYIPIQRKVFKLDGDEKSNVSAYEDMLRAVGNA